MYKCYDCGYVFDKPKNYAEDRTPGGVFEGGSFVEHYTGCPECSGAYGSVRECDNCGEYVFEECLNLTEYGEFCDECYEELGGDDF